MTVRGRLHTKPGSLLKSQIPMARLSPLTDPLPTPLDQVREEPGRFPAWLKGDTGRSMITPSNVMSTSSL